MTAPDVPGTRYSGRPTLEVTVGGVVLAQRAGAAQVLIEDATVDWGTDDPLAQPDPSTASLALLDLSLTWAARADLLGSPVTFRWLPDAAMAAAGTVSRVFFRGRVTGLEISPPEELSDATGRPFQASRVALTLGSVELDLANRFVTDGSAWPAEAISARASRIAALAGIPVVVRDFWTTYPAVPVAADDLARTSARDLLLQLYNSTGGDRMVYDPNAQRYVWMGRRQVDQRTLIGMTAASATAILQDRAGQGVFLSPQFQRSPTGPDGGTEDPPRTAWIDCRYVTVDSPMAKTAGQKITRAQVKWLDSTAANVERTAVAVDPNPANAEALVGQRAITLDSLHNGGNLLPPAGLTTAQDLLAMATQEGSQWLPPRIIWDTEDSGGFQTRDQVHVALRGHGTQFPIVLSGSWFATLGVRPLFSAIGGKITYSAGRWLVELQLAGWAASGGGNSSPVLTKQHAVTWEEMDAQPAGSASIVWTDGPTSPVGTWPIHESVTYEDMGFVGAGYGSGGISGPDIGWDEYV